LYNYLADCCHKIKQKLKYYNYRIPVYDTIFYWNKVQTHNEKLLLHLKEQFNLESIDSCEIEKSDDNNDTIIVKTSTAPILLRYDQDSEKVIAMSGSDGGKYKDVEYVEYGTVKLGSDILVTKYLPDEEKEVELKPLDISPYCKDVFYRCSKTLVMSATILNSQTFCRNVGINAGDVKFIQVQSDFPIENRPIYPLNIAYLNHENLQLQETKSRIIKAVDSILTTHKNDKGIIHTTSYQQLRFIEDNISRDNSQRLLVTDPHIRREEVIAEHISSAKPTVLISPSLNIGIDLKDELSRFQIITKIPYPNLADRWINAKKDMDSEWYYWQTALGLVQAYGRSIRSKEDWAKTYVLDSAFGYFVYKNRNLFPDWFRQAIRTGDKMNQQMKRVQV